MLKNIVVLFFAINAIFWSLFPRTVHCELVTKFTPVCPPHKVYLIMGIISFIIAFAIAQYDYLKTLF
jgi:hypothetical protein